MLLSRTKVYTLDEFREYVRLQKEKEDLSYLDRVIGHLKRNKKVYLKLVVSLAFYLFALNIKVVFAGGEVVEVMSNSSCLTFSELMAKLEAFGKWSIKAGVKTARIAIILLMLYGLVKDAFEGANHRMGNKFIFFVILLILVSVAPYLETIIDSLLQTILQGGV